VNEAEALAAAGASAFGGEIVQIKPKKPCRHPGCP